MPVETLNYSYFIILNLKNTLKYFFDKNFFPFKNLIANLISIPLFFLLKKKINFWENKFINQNIVQCKKIDFRFNYLWNNIKQANKKTLLLQRDKNFLEWHLGHFLENNQAWIFLHIKNKRINGYAICIQNNDDKIFKRAYLVDLISIDKKNEILTSLIGVCINEAKKRKCDIFEFRGFNGSKLGNIKSFKPFEKKLSFNPFYYKSNNKKLNKILNKSSHWSPSYIDGDVIVNF